MTPSPLVVLVVHGAGLVTGLSHFWAPLVVLLLLLGLALRFLRPAAGPHGMALLAGVLVLGWASGMLARRADRERCAAQLQAGTLRLRLHLHDPVDQDGGRGEAAPLGAGCRGRVTVRWPRGPARDAGAIVEVEARWYPRPPRLAPAGGTLVVLRARQSGLEPGLGDRVRTGLHREAQQHFGPRAPLVHALVLGRRDLDRPLRDAFARAGLAHLLAISGFHVGLIGGWVLLLLSAMGVGRARRIKIAMGCVAAYAVFLGLPPPATRAAAAAAILGTERLRGRAVRRGDLLVGCALLLLWLDPWVVVSVGAWLSCAAAAGVVLATSWVRDHSPHPRLVAPVAVSLGATVATAPIVAMVFGTVAIAGLGLNLVAVPLAALTLPAVLAALGAGCLGLSGLASAFARAGGAGLALLEGLAHWGSNLPWGSLAPPPGPVGVILAALPLGALAWVARRRITAPELLRRVLWVTSAVALLSLWPGRLGPGPDDLALHFLDVGQGDAIALRTPGGRWVLVDAGPAGGATDAGRAVVVPFLRRHRVGRLEALVVSHVHGDHLGGAPAVMRAFEPGLVLEPAVPVPDPGYLRFLGEVLEGGVRWVPAQPGLALRLDGVALRVLHPAPAAPGFGTDLNEDSVVLLVEFGCFRAVLTGDAGFDAESRLGGRVGDVAVLKVGHHGSRTASSAAWLAELRPEVAVVSLGRNRYGHPAPETVARLGAAGATLWRTDRDGTVSIRTDGTHLAVESARGARTHTTRLACSATPASPPSRRSSSTASVSIPMPAGN